MRANKPPKRRKLAESPQGCNLFHMERPPSCGIHSKRSTWNGLKPFDFRYSVPRETSFNHQPMGSIHCLVLSIVLAVRLKTFHVELFRLEMSMNLSEARPSCPGGDRSTTVFDVERARTLPALRMAAVVSSRPRLCLRIVPKVSREPIRTENLGVREIRNPENKWT
jgi:hypothetical protein